MSYPFSSETEIRRCVCPLWLRQGKAPEAIGSATLLKIGENSFALTAAHVLEEFTDQPVLVGTQAGFLPLVGEVNTSSPPDMTDNAFVRLNPEIANWLAAEYLFLSLDQVDVYDLPTAGFGYEFLGVPYRKVCRFNKRLFRFPVYSYTSTSISNAGYQSLGISPFSHVVVDFVPRRVRNGAGRRITAPNPQGMSGGPVFSKPLITPGTSTNVAKRLVALAIEHRKGVLIGIRIGLVLELLRRTYPGLANIIPALPQHLVLKDVNG